MQLLVKMICLNYTIHRIAFSIMSLKICKKCQLQEIHFNLQLY